MRSIISLRSNITRRKANITEAHFLTECASSGGIIVKGDVAGPTSGLSLPRHHVGFFVNKERSLPKIPFKSLPISDGFW